MERDVVVSLFSAIFRSRDAALEAGSNLKEGALVGEAKKVFDIAMETLDSGVRPDRETIETHLKARDQWTEKVERLLEDAEDKRVPPMNVGVFVDELNRLHIEDRALQTCEEALRKVQSGEIEGEKVLDFLEKGIFDIDSDSDDGFRSMSSIATSMHDEVQEAYDSDGKIVGVPSGLTKLDEITAGFQDGNLYVVAARPAMGKSALAGTCMYNSAEEGFRNAGHLLEMQDTSFGLRRAARKARVDSFKLRTGNISSEEMHRFKRAKEQMAKLPVWIDDSPGVTVEQIYRKLRRLKVKHDIDIVWVDYLQLIKQSGVGSSENVEVSHMSRMLKLAAKELDIPVVALSQLNRKVEHRSPPKPKLADLRSSGAIEQDADVVIFIYRPDVYGITVDEQGNSVEGIAKLLVEKHRGGPIGVAETQFNEKYATFENLAKPSRQ